MTDYSRPFVSRPEHWHRNLADSQRTQAGPALRTDAGGRQHPGVILGTGQGRMLILTNEDALRIANEIADALTYSKDN